MAHHFFHDYLLHISEGYSHGVTLAHLAEDKRPLFNIKYSIHFEMFTCCLINVTCTHAHIVLGFESFPAALLAAVCTSLSPSFMSFPSIFFLCSLY